MPSASFRKRQPEVSPLQTSSASIMTFLGFVLNFGENFVTVLYSYGIMDEAVRSGGHGWSIS